MKKTVITVIVTFVLTTLFWFAIGYLTNVNTTNDYSQDIIGKWAPIEVSEHYIEFTKYGTLKNWTLMTEFPYAIKRDIVTIKQVTNIERLQSIDFKFKITTDEDGTYLEIYDVTNLSGKYRKVY